MIMEATPRLLRAYLSAHERNEARRRPVEAMWAGFVHLSSEMRQTLLNMAAAVARDTEDEAVPPVGSQRRPDGVTVIAEKDVATWLKEHGGGVKRG